MIYVNQVNLKNREAVFKRLIPVTLKNQDSLIFKQISVLCYYTDADTGLLTSAIVSGTLTSSGLDTSRAVFTPLPNECTFDGADTFIYSKTDRAFRCDARISLELTDEGFSIPVITFEPNSNDRTIVAIAPRIE